MSNIPSVSNLSSFGLPKRLEKKFQNDKILRIALAVLTCGISLGVRAIIREIKAKLLNRMLLPAAFMSHTLTLDIKDSSAVTAPIVNNDNVMLDAKEVEINPSSKKWLVYFCGNGMTYQDAYEELKEYATDLGVNLLVFNYRGVGHSEGRPVGFNHLLTDGAACVEYLKKQKGAEEKDIVLYGFSLGGAIATVLSSFYDDVNVFNNCSFGDSIKAIYYMTGKGLIGALAVAVVVLTGTALHVGKYWKRIPSDRKFMAYHPYDGVIYKQASLYKAEKKRIIKQHPNYLENIRGKLRLPQDKKPDHIKLQGGSKSIDIYNHGDMNKKDEKEVLQAMRKLFNH